MRADLTFKHHGRANLWPVEQMLNMLAERRQILVPFDEKLKYENKRSY